MKDKDYGYQLEAAIVGGMLSWPKYIGEAASRLTPEDFFDGGARTVFSAILDLFFAGAPVDDLTVLKKTGADYSDMVKAFRAAGTAQVEYYCGLLLEYNRLTRAKSLALELYGAKSMDDARHIIGELISLDTGDRDTEPVSLTQLVAEYVMRKQNGEPPREYLSFGMKELDDVFFVEPGDLVVLGGYSSAGKTLLSLQFALHMAKTRRVGYFSLETDRRKLGDRMVSHYAQIGLRAIKQGTETSAEVERAVKMGMEVSEFAGGLGVHRLRAASVRDIRALTLRYRYDVVFVDYLQLLRASGRSRYEQITNVSLDLRELAQGGVTVIALAQLARPETTRGKAAEPGLWSFKESGQIENDADAAMLLYLADETDHFSPRVLKIAKNKDGELKQLLLDFDGAHQTMKPMEPSKAEKFRAINAAIRKAGKDRRAAEDPDQVKFVDLKGPDGDLPF